MLQTILAGSDLLVWWNDAKVENSSQLDSLQFIIQSSDSLRPCSVCRNFPRTRGTNSPPGNRLTQSAFDSRSVNMSSLPSVQRHSKNATLVQTRVFEALLGWPHNHSQGLESTLLFSVAQHMTTLWEWGGSPAGFFASSTCLQNSEQPSGKALPPSLCPPLQFLKEVHLPAVTHKANRVPFLLQWNEICDSVQSWSAVFSPVLLFFFF